VRGDEAEWLAAAPLNVMGALTTDSQFTVRSLRCPMQQSCSIVITLPTTISKGIVSLGDGYLTSSSKCRRYGRGDRGSAFSRGK